MRGDSLNPRLLLLPGALLALGLAGPVRGGEIALDDCQLEGPFGVQHTQARCGTLSVPENPAEPDGPQIELNVAVVPADRPAPEPSAVALLAGGPGQAATEAFAGMEGAFSGLNESRDILLVDQRGTGSSNPLDCAFEPEELWDVEISREETHRLVRRCLNGLDGADPRFYTTPIAMDDLDRVREALGYERLDLVGVSYGTRAAQVYLRRHPDRVRSMVLAGSVPMDEYLGLAHAANLERALNAMFEDCVETQECARAFGDPRVALDAVMARISEAPADLALAHPTTGKRTELTLGRDGVAGAIRLLSYTPEGQALLPLLVSDAHDSGELDRLAAQALMTSTALLEQLSRGMEMSVLCAEDVPLYPADWQAPADSVLGGTLVDYVRWSCEVWPRGDVPADYHQPVASEVPALLLSGEFDPVTPPAWGERVAESLANSRHFTVPGQAHALLGRGCVDGVVSRFVADAGFDGLDAECLDDMGRMPFFVDFTGPSP